MAIPVIDLTESEDLPVNDSDNTLLSPVTSADSIVPRLPRTVDPRLLQKKTPALASTPVPRQRINPRNAQWQRIEGLTKASTPKPLLRQPEDISGEHLKLLEEIERRLEPYVKSEEKPPLNSKQLFIIASLFNPDATFQTLIRWIVGNIPYYRNMALDEFASRNGGYGFKSEPFNMIERQSERFHLPTTKTMKEDKSGKMEALFHTAPNEARIFLTHFLPTRTVVRFQRRPFPLMRLPAELRLRIYELVLGFPKDGLRVVKVGQDTAVSVTTRDFNAEKLPSNWLKVIKDSYGHYIQSMPELKARKLPDHLGLLRVNKQIYFEAMPVFYNINSFICRNIGELSGLLRHTPEHRRNHIRHITFTHLPDNCTVKLTTETFKLLKTLKGLRTLDIVISTPWWSELKKKDGKPKYEDMLKLPGLHILKSMRGLEKMVIHEDDGTIGEFLVPEMTKPIPVKAETTKKTAGRKRKVAEDGEGPEGAESSKPRRGKKAKAS